MDFSMFENMKIANGLQDFIEDNMINNTINNAINNTVSRNNIPMNNSDSISRFPAETPVGMAYVPMQQWTTTYDEEEAFAAGTIFPELNLPFNPEEGCYGQR